MASLPQISNVAELQKYNVNLKEFEKVKQSLYDSAAYATGGATVINFFQQPQGQGGKTLEDTNMTLAGQLPTNQLFLVESIEVLFLPADPTAAAAMPAAFGAQAVATSVNDVYIFYRSGALVFSIGSKDYLKEAPLQKFPPKTRFDLHAAVADQSTIAGDLQTRIAYAYATGRPYLLNPPLLLIENQNFALELRWPNGAQAVTTAARIFVTLDGVLFRRAQ